MSARIKSSEHLVDSRFKLHSEALQPSDYAIGVVTEHLNACGITSEISGGQCLGGVLSRRIFNILFRLANRVRSINLTLSGHGITAGKRQSFDNDGLGSVLGGEKSCSHPGSASAYDNNVIIFIPNFGKVWILRRLFLSKNRNRGEGSCTGADIFKKTSSAKCHSVASFE